MSMYGAEVDVAIARLKFAVRGLKVNIRYFSGDRVRVVQSFDRYTQEIYDMAAKIKKNVTNNRKKEQEFQWKGFVNVNLTSDQKEIYKAWDIADDDVWDGIAQYCAAGYKINLSFNKQNDKFNCTGTGQPSSGENNGYAVSAFANTPYEAARVWLFKVSTILPDVWSEFASGDEDDIG